MNDSAARKFTAMIPATIRRLLRRLTQSPVATDYQRIEPDEVGRVKVELDRAWHDPRIPESQRQFVDEELAKLRRGESVHVYDVFIDLLRRIPDIDSKSLLEIGCSSGYYANVLEAKGWKTSYAGCDLSSAFIALARQRVPGVDFQVQDATQLTYAAKSYDVVVSGCCLLHITDYATAIRESARVAREYVLFHRTPVLHLSKTSHYRRRAYGMELIEIHFNEAELFRLFAQSGLHVQDVETVGIGRVAPSGDAHVVKSYLCRVS